MPNPICWPLTRSYRATATEIRGRAFRWGERTYLMAIINLTPDSFSGDGIGSDPDAAVERARAFEAAGADILDLGAESSRPGAGELDPAEELRRLMPCLEAVRAATSLPISVDTYHASVARSALAAGADAVNDIWGLRRDPDMAALVAETGAHLIAMHNQRGRPFRDVAGDIAEGFRATLQLAGEAGIPADRIILDPGFGFGWTPEQNLEMLRRLPEFWSFELPLLIGTSRKSTIGLILDAPVHDRLEGTAATVAFGIAAGADIIRVHDLPAMARVARVTDAIARANWRAPQPP
ncbi:dihydropteroate synthase [Tepidiforma sp.]|uniref:dihydropteroate synthase n=1 Tax=Tepidiforma sp. TaxID=2682230 RepID=UPI002ADD3FAE|nr:dihydropteroate synthase [Tepidiforma sp.]